MLRRRIEVRAPWHFANNQEYVPVEVQKCSRGPQVLAVGFEERVQALRRRAVEVHRPSQHAFRELRKPRQCGDRFILSIPWQKVQKRPMDRRRVAVHRRLCEFQRGQRDQQPLGPDVADPFLMRAPKWIVRH